MTTVKDVAGVANRLHQAAHGLGLTMWEAATRLGVSKIQLSYIINGRHSATEEQVRKWAAALDCSAEWLLTGRGDKERPKSGEQLAAEIGEVRKTIVYLHELAAADMAFKTIAKAKKSSKG